eukprot:353516-Chlamydomonas_euryale.AAC.8
MKIAPVRTPRPPVRTSNSVTPQVRQHHTFLPHPPPGPCPAYRESEAATEQRHRQHAHPQGAVVPTKNAVVSGVHLRAVVVQVTFR